MTRGLRLVLALLVFLVLLGAAWAIHARRGAASPAAAATLPEGLRPPAGVRVRVAVVNTTKVRGLARRAARVLRNHGFDVVETGASGPLRDSTLVLDRSSHPAWAASVAAVLGQGTHVESRPDSSRYLDITVLLGRAWRPPAEPLDP